MREFSVISQIMTFPKHLQEMLLHLNMAVSPYLVSPLVKSMFKRDSTDILSKVFVDDEKGIVCYRTETGEIVCEGRDEGPYYDPPEPRVSPLADEPTSVTKSSVSTIQRDDKLDLKAIEYMGFIYCEGRDEG